MITLNKSVCVCVCVCVCVRERERERLSEPGLYLFVRLPASSHMSERASLCRRQRE